MNWAIAVFERDARQRRGKALEQAAREQAAETRVGLGGKDGVEHLGEADRRKRQPRLVGAAGDGRDGAADYFGHVRCQAWVRQPPGRKLVPLGDSLPLDG